MVEGASLNLPNPLLGCEWVKPESDLICLFFHSPDSPALPGSWSPLLVFAADSLSKEFEQSLSVVAQGLS